MSLHTVEPAGDPQNRRRPPPAPPLEDGFFGQMVDSAPGRGGLPRGFWSRQYVLQQKWHQPKEIRVLFAYADGRNGDFDFAFPERISGRVGAI